jgi:hypothetical protein
MSIPLCHYCSLPINIGIPLVLWDGETYCTSCVDTVDPMLSEYARTHNELAETLTAENFRFSRILTNPQGVIFSLGCLCIFAAVCAIFADTWDTPVFCLSFCCLGFYLVICFLAFAIFQTDYFTALERLPRTVRVSERKLVIESDTQSLSLTLAECDWYPGYSDLGDTSFLRRCPAIIVYHPESKFLAIGLTPEMYRVWYAFLTLSGVRNLGRFPWGRLLLGWLVGIPSGIGLGVGAGGFLGDLTRDDLLPLACGLLGALDGFCIPIFFILGQWFGAVKGNHLARSWNFAGRYTLAFGMLGLFVAGGRGVGLQLLPAGLMLIIVNTCIEFLVGWLCGRSTNPPKPN